jgi:predicted phosphodiesterase
MLVFGGAYGNLSALQALLRVVGSEQSLNIVCTGDLVAYCADGAAVCELVRDKIPDATFVRGNCERAVGNDEEDCGCGFDTDSTCALLSVSWHRHARINISATTKVWMKKLPMRTDIVFGGRKLAVVHADGVSDNRFIFPSTPESNKQAVLSAMGVDGVIAGHSGIPFTQMLNNGGIWHNSGALGMPANDGTNRVWYALWTVEADGIHITHHALNYDIAVTASTMKAAGLPPDYRLTLDSGIWPSDSVLPEIERRQQGQQLNPPPVFWPSSTIVIKKTSSVPR